MPVDTTLIEALLTPIAGDAAAGKDLRYDPRYDQVKEARREDIELPAGGLATERKLADFPQVVKVTRLLLEKESKDLQLAAWLTEALLKQQGLSGLATGLEAMHGMLDRFWETCYPAWDEEDPELRAGPLQWIGEKLDVAVRQTAVAPGVSLLDYQVSRAVPSETDAEGNRDKQAIRAEALADGKRPPEEVDRAIGSASKAFYKTLLADVDAVIASAKGLEGSADERFGRDAPSFMRLRGALDDLRRVAASILAQKLIEDPDPIVEESAADAESEGLTSGANGVDGNGALPAEPVSAADAAARVAVAARYLRKQDPSNPAPYLLLRGLRWGELRTSAGELNPRLLEAPPTAVRSRLKGLLLDGKWAELVEQCEGVMATPQGRGWLDLQRYVLTACDQLGGGYDAVSAAVRGELRVLLSDLPQLLQTTLMDDTPTANVETQAWIAAEGLARAGRSGNVPNGDADSEIVDQTDSLDAAITEDDATSQHGGLRAGVRRRPNAGSNGASRDPFVQAQGELSAGRPNRAIELLLSELARERSPRGRFVRQTQIAYVMVEAGLETVARPILEKLVTTIDERTLEDWEAGPLVAQPMALLCRVIDKIDGEGSDQRTELYLRICRLDPLQAIALQRGA